MLKDILLSFMILSFFQKCAALHNDGGVKIRPYYAIKLRTSDSAAFIFRQLVSCTIFILLWEKLLCDAAPPSAGELTGRAPRCKCLAPLRPLSLYNRDWFLRLSLMTLCDCCVWISSPLIKEYKWIKSFCTYIFTIHWQNKLGLCSHFKSCTDMALNWQWPVTAPVSD